MAGFCYWFRFLLFCNIRKWGCNKLWSLEMIWITLLKALINSYCSSYLLLWLSLNLGVRELAHGLVVHVVIVKRILQGPTSASNGNWGNWMLWLEAIDVLRKWRARFLLQLICKSFERKVAAFLASRSAANVCFFFSGSSALWRFLLRLFFFLELCYSRFSWRESTSLSFEELLRWFFQPQAFLSSCLLVIRAIFLFMMNLAWSHGTITPFICHLNFQLPFEAFICSRQSLSRFLAFPLSKGLVIF